MYCSVVASVLTQCIVLSIHGLQLGGVGDKQAVHCLQIKVSQTEARDRSCLCRHEATSSRAE